MNNIKMVFEEYLNAPKNIKKMGLTWGYFLGGVVGIILLVILYWISGFFEGAIYEKLSNIFNIQDHILIVKFVIAFIIKLLMIAIYYFFFKTVLLIILAPFFGYISEKIENKLENREYKFSLKDNLNFIGRGVKVAVKTFFKEMILTIVILLLSFIPLVNLAVPILLFLIQSYFISFNFVDYSLERAGYGPKETLNFMKKYKVPFTFGGGIFTVLYFIPIVGIFVAPIISIMAFTTLTLKFLKD
nr:EI24 domain-containing protein [uncultured Cetobacterium sp.]